MMSCERTELEVAAYLDGELDLASALDLERHLAECAACARALDAQRALREAVGAAGLRYHPSPAQTWRLRRSLHEAAGPAGVPAHSWRRLQRIAALLLVVAASWSLGRFAAPRAGADLGRQVVESHLRSLLTGHPVDVQSADRHTVKPWFTGKLDYAPTVVDLAGDGFPLVGGRLDYLGHHPVAILVYRSDRHVINLFTWPAAATPDRSGRAPSASERQGFHTLHWSQAGMTYWAVSDVEEARLRRFAQVLSARLDG
jgi:anti-sigma factor RsiW